MEYIHLEFSDIEKREKKEKRDRINTANIKIYNKLYITLFFTLYLFSFSFLIKCNAKFIM